MRTIAIQRCAASMLFVACGWTAAQTLSPGADKPTGNTNPPAEDRNSAGAVVQERKADLPQVEAPSRAAAEPAAPLMAPPAAASPARKPSGKMRRIEEDVKRGTHNRV